MAYTTGACSGHFELLAALKTFLEAQGWTTQLYDTSSEYTFIACGPGTNGTDEIYIGVQTKTNSNIGYYNWILRGYTGYSSSLTFDTQPGYNTNSYQSVLTLTSSTITYWFIVDTRRVIVVAKCGTSYENAYMGLINPYAPSSQISYPLFIGGSSVSSTMKYTDQTTNHESFFSCHTDMTSYSQSYFLNGTTWFKVYRNATGYIQMYPFAGDPSTDDSTSVNYTYKTFWHLTKNIDDTYPIFPIILMTGFTMASKVVYGELSGVYAIPSDGLLPEDTLTIGSDTYLITQAAFRTTRRSFAAIKLA